MDETEIKNRLSQAEEHSTRYEWDAALACFDGIPRTSPKYAASLDGRRKVLALQAAEAQIVEVIGEARASLDAGRYDAAGDTLDKAQALAAEKRILNHHAEIFKLRDAAAERQRWATRVTAAVKQAQELENRTDLDAAATVLDKLLRDLTAAGLEGLGQPARQEWDRLRGIWNLEDRLEEIDQAFDDDNLRMACELAEQLLREQPGNRDVERKCNDMRGAWQKLQTRLNGAAAAVNEGRLEDARELLVKLKGSNPKNPDWQALWLQAFLGHGQGLVSAGQQAVQSHAFEQAQAVFTQATADFGQVLAVFPEHATAGHAQAEAQNLAEVTRWLAQASRDQIARRWDTARAALQAAREQLEAAGLVRKQDFGDVKAVVGSLSREVETAVDEIRQARTLLDEGLGELTQRAPDRAEDRFRKGLVLVGERDDALKDELLAGLNDATHALREVAALQDLASRSSEVDAAGILRQAYDRWPAAPSLRDRLVETMLVVAKQALDKGDEDAAVEWSGRVLAEDGASNDAHQRAQVLKGGISCKRQVAQAVAEAAQRQADLDQAAPPTAAGYSQLVAVLENAAAVAQGCREQLPAVETLLAAARTRLAALQAAEPLLLEAETLRGQGDWTSATETLARAAEALGSDLAGRGVRQRQQTWGEIAHALTAGLEKAEAALADAQRAYEVARDDLAAVSWSKLSAGLETAERALKTKPRGADPLPAAWLQAQARGEDLRRRADVLSNAWKQVQAGHELEALSAVTAAAMQRTDDPVLVAVRVWLRRQTVEQGRLKAHQAVEKARELASRDELNRARECLAEANGWDSESSEIIAEIARLDQQVKLLSKLKQNEEDGKIKRSGNSSVEAQEAFKKVLQEAQDTDSGLASEVRQQLADLLSLGPDLHKGEIKGKGDTLIASLVRHAANDRILANYVLTSVQAWFDLAVYSAQNLQITSSQALGNLVGAYTWALKMLETNPDNSKNITKVSEIQVAIQSRLLGSAQKRLGNAREHQDKGNTDKALSALDDIQDDLLKQVRSTYPALIEGSDPLDKVMKDVDDLRLGLKQIKDIESKLDPLAKEINQAYLSGTDEDLLRAEKLLIQAEIDDQDRLAKLTWKGLETTRRLIYEKRQNIALERVKETLAAAEGELAVALTPAAIQAVLTRLERARGELEDLAPEEGNALRKRVADVAGAATARLADLDQAATAETEARRLEAVGEWEGSLAAFQRGAGAARGAEKERLEGEVTRLLQFVRKRQAVEEDWTAALTAITAGKFDMALEKLTRAGLKGKPAADVEPYRLTAEAGQLYTQAQDALSQNPAGARRGLERARKLVEPAAATPNCTPAVTLLRQVEDALQDLGDHEQAMTNVITALRAAEDALRQGAPNAAREHLAGSAAALNTLAPGHRLRQQADALGLVAEAADRQGMEQFDVALDLVDQALKLDGSLASARRLKTQVVEEREVANAVALARSLAREKRFSEASAVLREKRDIYPSHETLGLELDEISKQEELRQNDALAPAHRALSKKEYRVVIQEFRKVMAQTGTESLKVKLTQDLQETADKWAEQVVERMRTDLGRDLKPQELLTLKVTVQELLDLQPAPTRPWLHQLKNLLNEIETRRLQGRLAEAQAALEQTDLEQAERIGAEVRDEAAKLDDMDLVMVVGRFNMEVQRRQREQRKDIRTKGLEQARQQLAEARATTRTRRALEAALSAITHLIEDQNLAGDHEATQLKQEIEAEIKRFDTTRVALEAARKRLSYSTAQQQVTDILNKVEEKSSLLNDEIEATLQLAGELQHAADNRFVEPAEALEIYERAVKEQPTLLTPLQQSMNECRVALLKERLAQADELLAAAIPDHAAAQALLAQAEAAKWVTPEYRRQVQARKAQAEGLATVAQAASRIEANGDLAEALTLLDQSRRPGQDERVEELRVAWVAVARAAQKLRENDLPATRGWAEEFLRLDAVAARPFVQALLKSLEAGEAHEQALKAARKTITLALGMTPPDYAEAVRSARRAAELASPPPPVATSLIAGVRGNLEAAIARQRKEERYDAARSLLAHLAALLPGETVSEALDADINQERATKLNDALEAAQAAVIADRLVEAERLLGRAGQLAGEPGDARIAAIRAELNRRDTALAEVNALLDGARTALRSQEFRPAIDQMVKAQRLAPKYDRVLRETDDLNRALADVARSALERDDFDQAANICSQALDLGDTGAFGELRREVLSTQKAAADKAHTEAFEALKRFDLSAATIAIRVGRAADRNDTRFDELAATLARSRDIAPRLTEQMESGWVALQTRAFDQARAAFQTAADLRTGLGEPELWKRYVDRLQDGRRQVNAEGFESAATSFESAANLLRLPTDGSLSPLWGDRLRAERRVAVYTATRLHAEAADIVVKRQKGSALSVKNDFYAASELLEQVKKQKEGFSALFNSKFEPPADFDATASGKERSQPVAAAMPAPQKTAFEPAKRPAVEPKPAPVLPVMPTDRTMPEASPRSQPTPEPDAQATESSWSPAIAVPRAEAAPETRALRSQATSVPDRRESTPLQEIPASDPFSSSSSAASAAESIAHTASDEPAFSSDDAQDSATADAPNNDFTFDYSAWAIDGVSVEIPDGSKPQKEEE